ncbi:integrase catalytic domain-containing protein [Trichonephila clavipes]|nr:integrase catalytic domain-containing protein [Trichonephila clavipes]
MAEATIPVTTPIKEENGMDDLGVVYVKVKGEQEIVNAVMHRCPDARVLKNLNEQEASPINLSTRATKQHQYDYKIGSLCFIKTPNIKSNLSPKLRPKFEGPYRVIERFPNVTYRVQHVEQLRKRFNTHVNRMIPFMKRFSYLHLNNLDDLQPDDSEVKSIVPSPRYNLRARAGNLAD